MLPRTSPGRAFQSRQGSRACPGLSPAPQAPRGTSQLGFLKARSHFLPTRLTSGNLSGSFPEPSGFLHGHVSCLCSPHSQPGHWAPNRCQAEPGRHRQLPRPLAAHSRAGPPHAGWVRRLQLALGLTNKHLRSNSMTLSLTKKQNKTKKKPSLKTSKNPRTEDPEELASLPFHSPHLSLPVIARRWRNSSTLSFYRWIN